MKAFPAEGAAGGEGVVWLLPDIFSEVDRKRESGVFGFRISQEDRSGKLVVNPVTQIIAEGTEFIPDLIHEEVNRHPNQKRIPIEFFEEQRKYQKAYEQQIPAMKKYKNMPAENRLRSPQASDA